jgi:thymidylate synthase
VNHVEYDNFADSWISLLAKIIIRGKSYSPREQATLELIPAQLYVDDMRKNILVHPARNLSYRFMVAEWLWIAAGREDVASISRYNRHIANFSDDGATFRGAYGPRLLPQVNYLLETLRKPDSRQGVASIWTPCPGPSKDIPCTLTWQLLSRGGKLHGIVNMRSSDIWLGLPYDFFNFSMLSMGIAGELGLEPGSLTFNLGSSHLYARDLEKANEVQSAARSLDLCVSPNLPGLPPAEDILDNADPGKGITLEGLRQPWATYDKVLCAETNRDALSILGDLEVSCVSTKP